MIFFVAFFLFVNNRSSSVIGFLTKIMTNVVAPSMSIATEIGLDMIDDRYVLNMKIGTGTFGSVYSGLHEK